jgi:hypothetical protein
LNHHRAGNLPPWVFLPDRHIGAVGDSCLNRPLIVDLRRREDPLLTIRIEAVENRVTRHQVVRCELCFDVRLGNDATDADIHSLEYPRDVEIQIYHRHVESGITVMY